MRFLVRLLGLLLVLMLVAFLTVLLINPQSVTSMLARLDQVTFAVRLGLVVVMYLVLLTLLYLSVRLTPRAQADTLSVRVSGAIAAVTVESVRERLLKAVGDVPGVASVTATLKSIRGKADIDMSVTTADDRVNIPEKQKEINRAIDLVIKKQLGLELAGRPRVNIRLGGTVLPGSVSAPVSGGSSTPSVTLPVSPAPMIDPPVEMSPARSVSSPEPFRTPAVIPAPVTQSPTPVSTVIPPVEPQPEARPEPEPERYRGSLPGLFNREPEETAPVEPVMPSRAPVVPESEPEPHRGGLFGLFNRAPAEAPVPTSVTVSSEPITPAHSEPRMGVKSEDDEGAELYALLREMDASDRRNQPITEVDDGDALDAVDTAEDEIDYPDYTDNADDSHAVDEADEHTDTEAADEDSDSSLRPLQ